MNSFAFRRRYAPCLIALLASCGGLDTEDGRNALPVWTVEGPSLRIGSVDDPNAAFQRVIGLAMSPDGILYSLHWGEASVRRWDAQGRPAGTIGRSGEGPGEFDTPDQLGFFGDSLWVMDRRAYRVSFFDLEGTFLGSVSPRVDMSPDPANPEAAMPRPTRPLRDGTFYGVAPAWSDAIARGLLTETKHVLMDAHGERLATVWTQPHKSTDILALLRKDRGGTFGSQPYGDQPIFHVGSDGILWVLDRRAFEGTGEPAATLTEITMKGDTLLSERIAYVPVPLPTESVDSAARAQADGMFGFMRRGNPGLDLSALEADLREATFSPDFVPPFRSMVIADDGTIWLEEFSPSENGSTWRVFGNDAVPLAEATLPAGLRVLLISGGAVWGVETDEFDVNYIARYDVVRR